jgi:hypothetical protein
MQLWRLEMSWMSQQATQAMGGIEVIEGIFEHLAEQWSQFPAFMGEMLAYQARLREWGAEPELSLAERLQAFPEMEGIESVEAESLDSLFATQIGRAMDTGALPGECDRELAMLALVALASGVPIQMRQYEPERIGEVYQNELQLLWRGLRAEEAPPV